MTILRASLLTATLLVAVAIADPKDGNICYWSDARAGVVRDSLYIEGGMLAICNGKYPTIPQRKQGLLYQLNFATPFDSTSNLTRLFNPLNETLDNSAPTYVSGFMVADIDEWYTFGGQAYSSIDSYITDAGTTRYAVYQPNPAASRAGLGPSPRYPLKGNITNKYISNGAGVSVPSESLGFYFSGLQSANASVLNYIPAANGSDAPTTLVKSMLKVDTSAFGESIWSTIPLPSNVLPRAEAISTWLPVGPKGILVMLGGLPMPLDLPMYLGCSNSTAKTTNAASAFMTNITIYDVATGRWYTQAALGTPPNQLAQACAVVATSSDNSMHNIYVYGGYNGVTSDGSDDVWVLSIPSFTWIKVASGTADHGRYSHVCAKPYPDQMFAVGGTTGCGMSLKNTDAIVDVFNLNTLKWTGSYDPSKWSNYTVPTTISDAVKSTPTASMDDGLLALFKSSYPGTVPTWYPYVTVNNPNVTPQPSQSQPSWVIPVAAGIGAFVGIVAIALVAWCCYFRNRKNHVSKWRRNVEPTGTSQTTDDDMTQVDSPPGPGAVEIYSDADYFKPRPHITHAEVHNISTQQHLASPLASSGISSPNRPALSHSSELPAEVTRYELPVESEPRSPGAGATPIIKSHPMYPPSLAGENSHSELSPSVLVSSPTEPSSGAMSPYELPLNRSREDLLPQPPSDQILAYPSNPTPTRKFLRPQSPPIFEEPVSPEHSTGNVSPDLWPVKPSYPRTPAAQPSHIPIYEAQQQHHRHTSSLDSGLTNLSSPSLNEDQRRSLALAALPDSPDAHTPGRPSFGTTGISANIEQRIQNDIKRKEGRGPPPEKQQSAYRENEDLYGGASKGDAA